MDEEGVCSWLQQVYVQSTPSVHKKLGHSNANMMLDPLKYVQAVVLSVLCLNNRKPLSTARVSIPPHALHDLTP